MGFITIIVRSAAQIAKNVSKTLIKDGSKLALKGVKDSTKTLLKGAKLKGTKTINQKLIKDFMIKKGKSQLLGIVPKEFKLLYKLYKSENKLRDILYQIKFFKDIFEIKTKEELRMVIRKAKKECQQENWFILNENLKIAQREWVDRNNRFSKEQLIRLNKERRQTIRENKQIQDTIDKLIKEQIKEQMIIDKRNQRLGQVILKRAMDKDWKNFKNLIKSLDPKEKKVFEDILNQTKNMYIVFDSSWIKLATFTPYYKIINEFNDRDWDVKNMISGNTRGVMTIQTKKNVIGNINGIYSWINISYSTWLRIISSPTGDNFWNQYYRVNRKNKKHITPSSKYYKRKRKVK